MHEDSGEWNPYEQESCAIFMCHLGLGDAIVLQGAVNVLAPKYTDFIFPCKPHSCGTVKEMISQCKDQYDLSSVRIHDLGSERKRIFPSEDVRGNVFEQSWRDDVTSYDDLLKIFSKQSQYRHLSSGVFDIKTYNSYFRKFNVKTKMYMGLTFCKAFYRQLGVSHSETYNWKPKPGEQSDIILDKLLPKEPFAFVHECNHRGLNIRRDLITRGLKVITPDIHANSLFDYIPLMEKAEELHFIDSSMAILWDRCEESDNTINYIHRYARPDAAKPYYHKHKWAFIGWPLSKKLTTIRVSERDFF